MHERLTNLRPVIFLQFAAGTPRTEVWRGLNGAATLQAICGKIVIAVSEDIDPASIDAVMWSLAYRTNPVEDVHIPAVSRRRAGRAIRRPRDRLEAADRRHAQARRCRRSRCRPGDTWSTRARCGRSSACRALNVQAPWHGYTLDDWTDTWETFARRTARGRLGGDRQRDAGAPAPRALARDAGAAGRRAERRLIEQEAPDHVGKTEMARVPYLQQSDLPPEHQDILARPIALNRAMANSPNAAKAMTGLAMYIRHHSKLDPRLRELAILQVGYLARSPTNIPITSSSAARRASPTTTSAPSARKPPAGRPSSMRCQKAVLRAAREMTSDLAMSDATFAALEKALGREQVIDLTLAIAFYNAVVRLLGTLQIDVEPEYQKYLEEHPLPR